MEGLGVSILNKVSVGIQCNTNAKIIRDRGSQTIRERNPVTKRANKNTQTMAEKIKPGLIIKNKSKDASVLCRPSSSDFTSQTPNLSINNSTQTNDLVTNSIEKGIFANMGIRATLLQDIVDQCHTLDLNLKCFLNTRRERTISISNGLNVGLLQEDIDPIQLIITETGKCTIIIPFRPVETKQFLNIENGTINRVDVEAALNLVKGYKLKFCPGIKCNADIASGPNYKIFLEPFPRVQSTQCEIFYTSNNKSKVGQCTHCFKSSKVLSNKKKRKLEEDPIKKTKRTKVESKYPISKLTPKSLKSRLESIKKSRRFLNKRVAKLEAQLEHKDMLLNSEQSDVIDSILNVLNSDFKNDVQKAIESGENSELLKLAWQRDSEKKQNDDKKAFFKDQRNCEESHNGNRWSPITIRIALAVFSRSPAAYKALKTFKIFKLPSASTLKKRSQFYDNTPGVNHKYLCEQQQKYEDFKRLKEVKGLPIPKADGVLIFDEVKVIEKLIWNSKNHQFIGFAMEEKEFSLLNDISNDMSEPKPTQYVLQFLWRDLTSYFDLIGPYFTFGSPVKHDKLLPCILETLRSLNAYNFGTSILMCDGASSNLAVIKKTMDGAKKAFSYTIEDAENNYEVNPSFDNPFWPGRKLYWMICPSHELKSLINSLHSSHSLRTKNFQRNGVKFGWQNLKDMYEREVARQKNGLLRYVPKMHTSYIIRDAWTKLNVKPAKIMQQPQVLSELYAHSHNPNEFLPDRKSSYECYLYLRACSQLFENGFLSKDRIFSMADKELMSIKEGYTYFADWLTEILKKDPEINLQTPKQDAFLAWQTWDLLRITVFGFLKFSEDFLNRYPDNFISPSRINGSAVESLFSQLKYASGSKLTGINYSSTQKAVRIVKNIHSGNFSNTEYRDDNLGLEDIKL